MYHLHSAYLVGVCNRMPAAGANIICFNGNWKYDIFKDRAKLSKLWVQIYILEVAIEKLWVQIIKI